MATSSTISYTKRTRGPVDFICVDLGTGYLRMASSNIGNKTCKEIGNYPAARAGTPSLVPQAPSSIIYEPDEKGPAKPVAFGYAAPCRKQVRVSRVKIALLFDPENYGYSHSHLVGVVDSLRLQTIQQIPEDFLRFAIEHATKECGGQPKDGWAVSVPQYYKIEEAQSFQEVLRRAGCIGDIYIHGESDCVTYANLTAIEDIIGDERDSAFQNGENFTVTIGIFDLGAGTADITTCEVCFKVDSTPPTVNELGALLSFAIGGDLFDERFIELLRSKFNTNTSPDRERVFLGPFVERFREQAKTQSPTDFEDDEYPFRVPDSNEPFTLTAADMTCIMDPPIDESCRRIGEHLVPLAKPLDLIVISGGNSEVPDMIPRLEAMLMERNIVSDGNKVIHLTGQLLNAVIRGLHYRINQGLLNGFRAPKQEQQSSNSSISNDTLLGHLEKLKSESHSQKIVSKPSLGSRALYLVIQSPQYSIK
ncbi:hypothetical protein B0O99DRAFT_718362 [Bisporella sp. PMI_857]|nr:hypothetical protein B0O99DRAFT_718362 [Bisporella sp. PMI_857]